MAKSKWPYATISHRSCDLWSCDLVLYSLRSCDLWSCDILIIWLWSLQQQMSLPRPPASPAQCQPESTPPHQNNEPSSLYQLQDINHRALGSIIFNKAKLASILSSLKVADNYISSLMDGCWHVVEDITLNFCDWEGLFADYMDIDNPPPVMLLEPIFQPSTS